MSGIRPLWSCPLLRGTRLLWALRRQAINSQQSLASFRRDQQMKVVVHDHVGMNGHLEGLCVFMPKRQQTLPVGIVTHDGLSVIATLNDMVRIGCNSESGLAGHELKF